jgi:isopenicillin-N epimerase
MLGGAATLIVAGSAAAQNGPSAIPSLARSGDNIAQDRAFWAQVASHYDVDRSMANLENGYYVILDAAHSWGQIDFQIADLGVDFIGFNLHKWIGAPVGLGFLYIRKGRLDAIDRHYGDGSYASDDIRTRVHTGTANFATVLTLPLALKVHEAIGTPAKAARLRYLRDSWVARARALPDIEVLTPDEPGLAAGITSFRVKNKGSREDNNALVVALRDKHKVLTVRRDGVAKGQCIRVSPALYTTEEEIERLVAAIAAETGTA